MIRLALFSLLVATSSTACVGDIIGETEDPTNADPVVPEEPNTKVKVVVQEGGAPVPSMPVIFQNADDSVVAEATTGPDGSAIADLPNGGTVTIIRLRPDDENGNPVPASVYTYVGVKAGDVLDLRDGAAQTLAPPTTITVKVPVNENGTAQVITPCGSGAGAPPDIQVQLTGCAPGTEIGFYVTDGVDTSFFKRATLAAAVDLSGEAYKDATASQISVTGTPAEAQVTIEKRLETDGFVFFTAPPAQGPTANVTTPDAVGAEQIITATVSGPAGTQLVAKHDPFAAAPATVDLLADMIAYTSPATVAPDGTLTWTESGPGVPDLVHATYSVAREGTTFTRSIVAPHTGSTLRLPVLPATYATFNVIAGDQASATHQLAKFSSGYDSVRATIFNGRLSSNAPMGGRAAISYAAGQVGDDQR